ncbi:free fatty acid receptor 4-like [Anneissia japonica]|uniref:free fatty acid receptor 4-like n=1 Tax=Anneissia japonica TaxID=1529436 RepID=UPI0014255853|nr:free fatty acid receptor 4-like [Anneissia japonica]
MSVSHLTVANHTYFTFFSEFNRSWSGAYILETTVLTSIFNVAIIGNVLVLMVVVIDASMRTVTNYLVSNLALADIVFLLSVPFVIATRITQSWEVGLFACKSLFYIEFVSGFCSIWTMVIISFDRFRLIVQRNKKRFTVHFVIKMMMILLVVALVGALPMFFNFDVIQIDDVTICSLKPEWSSAGVIEIIYCVTVTSLGVVVPLIIIAYTHRKIRTTISENSQRVASMSSSHVGSSQPQNIAKESPVLRMLVLLVWMFAIMWIPVLLMILYIATSEHHRNEVPSHFFLVMWSMTAINCAVNPILYGILNENYKRKFKKFWYAMCGRQNVDNRPRPNTVCSQNSTRA